MAMLVVAALGGNALLRRGEHADAETQRRNVAVAVEALAEIATEHRLVVTHGNGPQVGLLALQAEAYTQVRPYPLDVLGAESEGMIGYLLEQGLENRLADSRVATLLTQVIVDADDPAFSKPTKPVGPVYERDEAERLARARGWTVAPDVPAIEANWGMPTARALAVVSADQLTALGLAAGSMGPKAVAAARDGRDRRDRRAR
jgi:carbamate kinase